MCKTIGGSDVLISDQNVSGRKATHHTKPSWTECGDDLYLVVNPGPRALRGVSDLNFSGADTTNANIRVSTLSQTSSAAGLTYFTTNGFGFFVNQTRVYFNTYNAGSQSANCKRMIITHELGHATGLGHREGAYVMRSTTVDCETRYNPQTGDINSMNAIY